MSEGWGRRLRVGAAPGLLAAVACAQIVAATSGLLSPWKGGGFGMFASVDRTRMRVVRAVLSDGVTEQGVAIPGALDAERLRAQVWPDDRALARLLRRLEGEYDAGAPVRRVEVWRMELADDGLALRAVRLASAEGRD